MIGNSFHVFAAGAQCALSSRASGTVYPISFAMLWNTALN
jgi:hypothetical protein